MGRPSSIDKLPKEIRSLIADLRDQGCTIDQIRGKLWELDARVSRSALGRHIKGLQEISERIRRSREIADALVKRFGDAPESKTARLNIEMMQAVLMEMMGQLDDENGQINLKPADAMFLAKSLDHLAKAGRVDADRILKERAEAERKANQKAAAAVEKEARKRGLTTDTIQAIRDKILGGS
tara:strand:- start:7844 stop:8389 length:546 start_codon:yes stop_codon:yes gene_type:complete